MQSESGSRELELLRPARMDAQALVEITKGREIGLIVTWFVLRGAALASRRIRLSVTQPLAVLWCSVGSCGSPPRDQSHRFAVVAITLTLAV